ncbi:helix-turn-helix domain-containing protein [Solibacillus sp. FSL R7-0668]|uniref:helix-turn-helix domain-containing protein n=1 Tax=Solibacillus sp. FSL R7-0668 TaxID=2921688 RepID=UPI0030FC235E
MNNEKIGLLILTLRKDKGLTQRQLADALHLSDRTISKWERGQGCPDITLLAHLSTILEVNIETLLGGEIQSNDFVGGNMKKSTYYVCPSCMNIGLSTGNFEVACCGRKIEALEAVKATDTQKLAVEEIDMQWSITAEHPMTKEHYVSFVAFATGDQIQLYKQFPEWALQVHIPKKKHGILLWFDTRDGLFYQYI